MLKNILVTSLRNFFRNKSFSLINLIGLSVSMSLSMFIIMIMKEQLGFDDFHSDSERIYRVNNHVLHPEWGNIDFATAPLPVGQVLEDDCSFIENVVRISKQLQSDATYKNVTVPVSGLIVDPSFVDVFNFPFSKGNPATALVAPNSLVLTKKTAQKIFGMTEPLEQTITLGQYGDFTITGVLEEFPGKTHFEFEMLCSMSSLAAFEKNKTATPSLDDWSTYYNNHVYVKLKEGRNVDEVEKALSEISKKYGQRVKSEGREVSYDFYLQRLEKITPGPELAGRMGKGMPTFMLAGLSVLAGVVLLMSIFNFTNLTIAKSLSRVKEIGVRKVVGANRSQVFFQFIGEAVVFSLVALVFSYVLLEFLRNGFLRLSLNQNFLMELNGDISLHVVFILFAMFVGIVAGVLPAAYLSALKPNRFLNDSQNLKISSRLTFRKVLMITQFTLSVIFVIVVQVLYRQIDFMLTSDYGIAQSNTINVDLRGIEFEKIANEVRGLSGVVRVGGVSHGLGTFDNGSSDYQKAKNEKLFAMYDFMVDDNYIENLALTFLAGHNFDALTQGEIEKDVILNETAATRFGFKNPIDAIGQTIYTEDTLQLEIIGIVKDFHFRPLNNKIGPLALRFRLSAVNYLSAKIHPSQKQTTIESLTTIWKKHDPVHPIEFKMMEDQIDDAYKEAGMQDVLVMVSYITFLVISIACLGMLGMAMYASRVRAKEVGIRKVMGATIIDLLLLLSKSFMILIGIALLIGVPISVFMGEAFLQDFPYKVEFSPLFLLYGIAVIIGLGLLMVWSQTVKVAISNPVKWLRHE